MAKRKTAPKRAKAASSAKRTRKPSLLRFALYWSAVCGLWGGIAVAGVFAFYAALLPSADTWVVPDRPPNMKILAADGTFLANRGVTGGKELRLSEMAPAIPQAVIAIEDHRFHAHWGFDPIGFARAMVVNLMTGRMRQGGSTLTQQLAKNLFLTAERNIPRKIQELILAFWLEANYSKAEILELYLNRVYFGAGATGVDAAARRYFGKSARDVTIAEAALLAGLLKAPSRYSPAVDPTLAQARAQTVLVAMKREGYRTEDGADATQAGLHAKHFRDGPENYVADMISKEIAQRLPGTRADIVVETTVDPFMMTAAQQALATALEDNGKANNIGQGALVSLAPDGAVRALIGGRSYAASQFNRATEAERQPGSAFKGFVYLAALESSAFAGYAAQRYAGTVCRVGTGQLQSQVRRPGHIATRLCPLHQHGGGTVGDGGRPPPSGASGQAAGHRVAPVGKRIARAGHIRGHADGARRIPRCLRQRRHESCPLSDYANFDDRWKSALSTQTNGSNPRRRRD